MIEINLLKRRLEKYRKKILLIRFIIFYLTGLVTIFLICGIFYLSNKIIIERIKNEIKNLDKEIMAEKVIFENLKTNDKKLQILCQKCSFYEDEYKDRILWSDIFWIISDSLPSGIWIKKLSYKKGYTQKGKNFNIFIEGYISPYYIQPEKGCSYFAKNLMEKGKSIFEKISLLEIRKEKKEDNEIYYFKFELNLKEKNERFL
ncbi:MAG TPA: hypothetical protein PKV21_09290 [bacterium]|nr:hypothetical protein [bacterium]HOM27678.1 hypothetical protein [bacterium]